MSDLSQPPPHAPLAPTATADPILAAIRRGDDLVGRLYAAAEVIAVSYARLRFLELHPEATDDLVESGRAITRRIRATHRLVQVELAQARHAATEQVDLSGPTVRRVLDLLVAEIEAVAVEVLGSEVAAKVIGEFRARAAADERVLWP